MAETHVEHPEGHVVSFRLLLAVFAGLLMLTALTVAVAGVDLGKANIWVALGVAVVKATLVALYFMHLRWDSPFNATILAVALLFVAIFIGATLVDSEEYQVNYAPPSSVVTGR